MSVFILPRWQRTLVRWFLERTLRRNRRPSPCPLCKEPVPPPQQLNDALWDMVVVCPYCGHATSLMDFGHHIGQTPEEALAQGHISASRPPGTRITVEHSGTSTIWTLPAKGGCSFLLLFGSAWFAFSSFMLGVVLLASKWEDVSGMIFASLFLGVFVLIGVGLLYGGLVQSYARHVLTLDVTSLTHERRLSFQTRRKTLPREQITSVELVVFYSENYKPVHGIEIKAGPRKIRFGSVLTPEEKAWLLQDFLAALGLHQATEDKASIPEETAIRAPASATSPPPERIQIEQHPGGCVLHIAPGSVGKPLVFVGTFMLAVTSFMLVMGARMFSPEIPLPFSLLFNGFILFWCVGVAMGVILAISIIISGWRVQRTRHQITATPEAVQVIEVCGRRQYETLVHASEVQEVRIGHFEIASTSADSTQKPYSKYRAVIVLQDRVIGFGGGSPLVELHSAVDALNVALGRISPEPVTT